MGTRASSSPGPNEFALAAASAALALWAPRGLAAPGAGPEPLWTYPAGVSLAILVFPAAPWVLASAPCTPLVEASDPAPCMPGFVTGPCGEYGAPAFDALPVELTVPPGEVADVDPGWAPDPGAAAVPGADGEVPLVALPPGTGTATLTGCNGRNVCPSRSASPLPSVGFFWLIARIITNPVRQSRCLQL